MNAKAIKEIIDLYAAERDYYKNLCQTLRADSYQQEKELLRKNEIIQSYEDPTGETDN